MFKNLALLTFAAASFGGSILAPAASASAMFDKADTVYVSAFAPGGPSYAAGVSRQVARKSLVVAEYPSWCYWHPYHCDSD